MSIIKRKAGSEDIVKSVLEFDEVPTEGSHNLVESGSVAKAIGNLGQPLQWKDPATVAELNAGITGIQPGWTYTLTDAGTLTDGSIEVEAGDEVAWTEDDEWFKVGGDSGKVEVIQVDWDTDHYTWPTYSQVFAALDAGKSVAMVQTVHMVGSKVVFWLQTFVTGSPAYYYFVSESYNGAIKYVKIYNNGTVVTDIGGIAVNVIADEYDATATYVVGDVVMHGGQRYSCSTAITTPEAWNSSHWAATSIQDSIGNVETLLAAL